MPSMQNVIGIRTLRRQVNECTRPRVARGEDADEWPVNAGAAGE